MNAQCVMDKDKTDLLRRNEKIRKRFRFLTEQKHYDIDHTLGLLKEEFLPLKTKTIWLIISKTGHYKNM